MMLRTDLQSFPSAIPADGYVFFEGVFMRNSKEVRIKKW